MIVVAMDRDQTVETNAGPVPIEWIRKLDERDEVEIFAVGNQALVEEADIKGRETLYDMTDKLDEITLGARESKTEAYSTLVELFPDAEQYIAVDDADAEREIAEEAGFVHYYPEEFVTDNPFGYTKELKGNMDILYHSAPPTAETGYGVHTKNLAPRLHDDFHVDIHAVGGVPGEGINWNGIEIYPSGAGKHGQESIPYWYEHTGADVVFSHHDHWGMINTLPNIQSGIPMVLYTILDHSLPGGKPPKAVVEANAGAHTTIVMSQWAESIIKNSKIDDDQIHQIPHGVNTSKYAPVTKPFIDSELAITEEELKRELGVPEDCFLYGMVAANYGPRKNIPNHIQAFDRLIKEDDLDDVYMYIHTNPLMSGGYNLYQLKDVLNIPDDRLLFPDAHKVFHGIDDETVIQMYNTFDVSLNVTQAESWGLTITEALSCGTPVIAANNSAQTEQLGVPPKTVVDEPFITTDHGLLVNRGTEIWTQKALARRFIPKTDHIYDAMKWAYDNQDKLTDMGRAGRKWVTKNYDWDMLYEEEWKPLFDQIERELLHKQGEYGEHYFNRRERETDSPAFKNEAVEIILECRGDSVLDVGCGTGALMQILDGKGYEVAGVEYAEEGVKRTKEKDLEVYQGDARDLQFKDNSFDTIVCQHVLEHIKEDVKAMLEMWRVAHKKLIIILPIGNPVGAQPDKTEERRYNQDEIDRLTDKFEEVAGVEPDVTTIKPGERLENWMITVGE